MKYLWQCEPSDELEISKETFTTSVVYVTRFNHYACSSCAHIILYREIKNRKQTIIIGNDDFKEDFAQLYENIFAYCTTFQNYYILDSEIIPIKDIIRNEYICDFCNRYCTIVQTGITKRTSFIKKSHVKATYFILAKCNRLEIESYIERICSGNIFTWDHFMFVKFASSSKIYDERIRYEEAFWEMLHEATHTNPSDIYREAVGWYKHRRGYDYRNPIPK